MVKSSDGSSFSRYKCCESRDVKVTLGVKTFVSFFALNESHFVKYW